MMQATRLQCACARVQFEVQGTPILCAECHCNSCRAAGEFLKALESAPSFLAPNGGTPFVLYRKDHIRLVEGASHLKEFRLSQAADTRRVLASCCGTPVFLEFQAGHWLSLYSSPWPASARPQPELRTMTRDLPLGSLLAGDIPSYGRQSVAFFAKLLGAWIAMGFRVPKITFVQGALEVPQAASAPPPA